jgi:PAS domain S-box-containing protein
MDNNQKKRLENIGWWSFDLKSNHFFLCENSKKIYEVEDIFCPTLFNFINFFKEDSKVLASESINELIKTQTPFVIEGSVITTRGKEIWVRMTGAVALSALDEVTKISGTLRVYINEINDEFRNKILYRILDEIAIISITDPEGKILYANQLFTKTSGYILDELVGKSHRIIKSNLHSQEFFKEMWDTIKAKKPWTGQITNQKKNGEHYIVDSHVYPVLNYKNEITEFISVRFDVTEKTIEAQKELIKAKFQMMGETSAQIMHDVMNPLSIIQVGLQNMQRHAEKGNALSPEQLLQKIAPLKDSCHRITKIFRNMKDLLYNKVEIEDVDIQECLIKALEISEMRLKKHSIKIEMEIEIDELKAPYLTSINFQQLLQVFINLINNSIDATEPLDNRWIKFKITQTTPYIVISIIDSGNGIQGDLHGKIFDSLFTTKEKDKGTGLGLSICKRIIENIKGKIELNADSPNTQFDIYLLQSGLSNHVLT